ncbi:hypothetical protein [Aestuariivivens sediminis]|uniref:hypothetical protein n=1 Tax=Aestuariivivens sediminis TaxID=2913557 RepID=UPI001F5853EB|nr:hypothetical protein [Aestuariivivens sediminis]
MKSKEKKIKYGVWLNAEIMHNNSRKWLSELEFAKDEQLFFDDLIKSYTLQLIDSKYFSDTKKIIDRLSLLQNETETLIRTVRNHDKGISIMLDDSYEVEKEEAYKKKHGKLIVVVNSFMEKYKTLKSELFTLIAEILKDHKLLLPG